MFSFTLSERKGLAMLYRTPKSLLLNSFEIQGKKLKLPGIVDDMNFSKPNRESSVHEGDDTLHLFQPDTSQMTESEAADIIDDSQSRYLGLHFSCRHLQQTVGGGVEVLQKNFVRVPATLTSGWLMDDLSVFC